MNRLQHETSPYLRQHAHNPVDWYAWKPEAFERARREDKPILVSIGYSTCHWCHVMERESFEDKDVADYMNFHFICIKVDREERPDVDQIYMEACQVFSGSGGWPLNCFLTPDGRPYYAGTYFPPSAAYNRPSWIQVLQQMQTVYRTRREVVEDQANRLLEMIRKTDRTFVSDIAPVTGLEGAFTPETLTTVFQQFQRQFDTVEGGFGSAPKFPGSMSLQFLLEYYHYTGNQAALDHVVLSIDKMVMGGIYDQLGGGFARYATDRAWLVPHFEKMLYDNALLVTLLADAYRATGKSLYRETIRETLDFIEREMTCPEGGFYSALDADSEGVEGKFYVWTKAEVEAALGTDAPLFCAFYEVTEAGNWEHHNILWRPASLETFAAAKNLDPDATASLLGQCREKLLAIRAQRIRPGLDDKILLDWNALMVSAYAGACAATGEEKYAQTARRQLDFLLRAFRQGEGLALYHTYKDGTAQYDAFLDDYAFLIAAMLDVYAVVFDPALITLAGQYAQYVLDHFWDSGSGLFYFTSEKQTDVLYRKKELYDNAQPSGNATMALNLLRLSTLSGEITLAQTATQMLLQMKEAVGKYPSAFARWASAIGTQAHPQGEIALIGSDAFRAAIALNREYLPHAVVMAAEQGDDAWPLLAGKNTGDALDVFVCKNYACQMPVKTIAEAVAIYKRK
ncbi:MAG: thioredoxin domain-containing protein [Saprospiraceae bacterium]|nr:thioredoxin domain-containing protein [Saprospiraceae bacterium]